VSTSPRIETIRSDVGARVDQQQRVGGTERGNHPVIGDPAGVISGRPRRSRGSGSGTRRVMNSAEGVSFRRRRAVACAWRASWRRRSDRVPLRDGGESLRLQPGEEDVVRLLHRLPGGGDDRYLPWTRSSKMKFLFVCSLMNLMEDRELDVGEVPSTGTPGGGPREPAMAGSGRGAGRQGRLRGARTASARRGLRERGPGPEPGMPPWVRPPGPDGARKRSRAPAASRGRRPGAPGERRPAPGPGVPRERLPAAEPSRRPGAPRSPKRARPTTGLPALIHGKGRVRARSRHGDRGRLVPDSSAACATGPRARRPAISRTGIRMGFPPDHRISYVSVFF